ncbi:MAG TPA: glycoside hydrolase family 2 TIM barrel-domain containing protein [Thermoleophilaceae bacterium]|nr:glycoside hydrolase family 2 TIM barrel-domain containing protein [Thermoleophilaceae bacterium]
MLRSALVICLAVAAACPLAAHAQVEAPPDLPPEPELLVERPEGKPLFREGHTNRELLGGTWYFRQDDSFVGEDERWFEQEDLAGWTAVSVPHNWNAQDTTENRGTIGWYRKEFSLPRSPKRARHFWKVRFEGNNYRTKLWLNGEQLAFYTGYFPFEVLLKNLRPGRNTLVAEVSSLRSNSDLTHWRPAPYNGYGTGGWWNFGGILREVYARRVDTVDIEDVHVLPRLARARGPARVEVRTLLRNFTSRDRDVALMLRLGGERYRLDPETVPARGRRELRTRLTIRNPRLWAPRDPELYDLSVGAVTGRRERSTYRVTFGVRKIATRPGGIITINGKRVHLRGASIHEDDRQEGGALSQATRTMLVNRLKSLGATITRSHYPLHPALIEALDRAGIMYWVQAPVYQIPTRLWARPGVRSLATRAATLTVKNNLNHPSVLTWSLANEPAEAGGNLGTYSPSVVSYIRGASRAVRQLDDTRLVGIDRQSRVGEPLTTGAHQYLDVLGVNDYFGWYRSVIDNRDDLPPTTTADLSKYLDDVHAANPDLPLVITEFGAEATRSGPETQKGTYEFQRRFALDHLAIHGSKRFVNGSIYWALRDFRIHQTWEGGAPEEYAAPPWHNKSLIEETNARKPVFLPVGRVFRRTKPLR